MLEDISITESEINLDEFSSIDDTTIQYGGKCGKCGGEGHNARTCGKKKTTPKPKKKVVKKKVVKTVAKEVKTPASHEQFVELLNAIKLVIFKIICTSNDVLRLDLRDFKMPKKGLDILDLYYNNDNEQSLKSCKIKSFTGYNPERGQHDKNILKYDIKSNDLRDIYKNDKKIPKPKRVKSFVYPLISTKFITGPSGGYGGLKTIDSNSSLMQYVGALEKGHNMRKLVINSKNDWKKLQVEKRDPLYYHFVILEGKRERKRETSAKVLGYIRLMRKTELEHDFYLRIVIREEGRGVGKQSLYQAITMLYPYLQKIYSKNILNKFNILAETNIENTNAASTFPKWGFYKVDGGLHGVFKKVYGDVYIFKLSFNKAMHILNPKYKTFRIPNISRLKHLTLPPIPKHDLSYIFTGLENGFKDEKTARCMLKTISNTLRENGVFISITKDSINLLKQMTEKSGSFGNELYNITYSNIDTSKNFGIRYKMSSNTSHNEYLLKNEIYKSLAKEYFLNDTYSITLDKFFEETREIPLFLEIYRKVKTTPSLLEMLSLLRLTIFTNDKKDSITGLTLPKKTKKKRPSSTMSGGAPLLTIDKIIDILRDSTPRIYYNNDDKSRGVREGCIQKTIDNKVIVVDDETGERFAFNLDMFRFLNRDELKKWGRGPKNFKFVTHNVNLNMDADRNKCVYLDNSNALWETVRNIDSWTPFVYRNDPDEKFVILYDKEPKASQHFLIVPKRKTYFKSLTYDDSKLLDEMRRMAMQHIRNNFINTRFKVGFMQNGGNQSQLHLHVISNDVKKAYRSKFSNPNFISVNRLIHSLKH